MNLNIALRIVVFMLIELAGVAVLWDTLAIREGAPTLSDAARDLNVSSGGIVAWFLLALWLHLFANWWK